MITRTELIRALELIQEALDAKHPTAQTSEDVCIVIHLPNAPLACEAFDTEGESAATGLEEIADYLHAN